MTSRIRGKRIEFYVTDEEYEMYKSKMEAAGYHNMSAYFRDMGKRGYVIKADTSGFDKYTQELNAIGKNINQIAKVCNTEQSVFLQDVEDLQKEMDKIFAMANELLAKMVFNLSSKRENG